MYYFAYASNLSKQRMRQTCPDAKPFCTATLPNHKIVFTGWSREWRGGRAAVLSSAGDKVRGALYEVTDACLRKLDRFEPGYTRRTVTVYDEDGTARQAVTYMKDGRIEPSEPSRSYGELMRQGYRDWGVV
jgi:gamma-glutamylcyclotransferase